MSASKARRTVGVAAVLTALVGAGLFGVDKASHNTDGTDSTDSTGASTRQGADLAPVADDPEAPIAVRVASLNTLGFSHTIRSTRYADGRTRTGYAVQLLQNRGVGIAGLQEFQREQAAEFRRIASTRWGLFEGDGSAPRPDGAVIWQKSQWRRVSSATLGVKFGDGTWRQMPMVILERTDGTGARVAVMNLHLPAGNAPILRRDATLNAAPWADTVTESGTPIFVTGDVNEKAPFFCRITASGRLIAANGGSNIGGTCTPPSNLLIDQLYGSNQVTFSNYTALRNDLVRRTTDHPLVYADASIPRYAMR